MANKKNTSVEEDIFDPNEMFVTLELDDGEQECRILKIYEAQGQDYIVLIPLDDNGNDNEEGEVFIYRYFEDEEGNPSLENIIDDDEFEMAFDKFDQLLDEEEFDQM